MAVLIPDPVPTVAPPVLVSLSSYGMAEVRRHGQAWFTTLVGEAGADGVEVRGELLIGGDAELNAIRQAADRAGLQRVYSSHEGLWAPDGSLNKTALARALAAAARLGAPRLKMSIGHFGQCADPAWDSLSRAMSATRIELLIENDQTEVAGTLHAMQSFFAAATAQGLDLGMTFDMGNWHWQGECPLQAARALAAQVCYLHCKGVQRQPQRWVAVPLAESAAPWRAIVRAIPVGLPWAIEYPLVGDNLAEVTRAQLGVLRDTARSLN